ncbi:hypothetical protein HY494_02730 [Candidatus Woesearchaeota archaeon]|nr:hypothetical protein [Candidatus Woesearchaeota archaeon]
MGEVIDSKMLENDQFLYKILMNAEEFLALQGNLKNVYPFTSNNFTVKAEIMESAIKGSTKYFNIPKEFMVSILRKNGAQQGLSGSCINMDIGNKVFFIYVIRKEPLKY